VLENERLAELIAENKKLAEERSHYRDLYLQMLEQCRKLEQGILGPKSERLGENEAQLTMAVLETLLKQREKAAAPPAEQVVREHTRQKPTGRKPLPENLPRVEIEVLPDEVQREGLDAFERIGQDVSETVERRPGSLVVVRVCRPKFVRKDRERCAETRVVIAPVPELPIERALPGPGMLADGIVRRWQDHLPLNRLEQIYAREGLPLARSTICGWHIESAALARPLVQAMWLDAWRAPYLCTDATGVLVQAKEKYRRGHFGVVVVPEQHVLYAYSPTHDSEAVDRILAGYKGYLVADAHSVYDHLYRTGRVIEVACHAHLRRYFFKSVESDPERARRRWRSLASCFVSSARSQMRRPESARVSASGSRVPSSMNSLPGATPKSTRCSTRRPLPRRSATHGINETP
jgi:transposase